MGGLFEDIALFDEGERKRSHQAAAVAQKRISDQVGNYLKISKTREEYEARLDFVSEDIRRIVADVAEEYGTDEERLLDAIDEHLKGDGVTNLTQSLDEAPSAVGVGKQAAKDEPTPEQDTQDCPSCNGTGELKGGSCPQCHGTGQVSSTSKQAAGHPDGCTCGFCKNKGNLPGMVDQEEQKDKDASESHDSDDDSDDDDKKESSVHMADVPPPAEPTNVFPCKTCGTQLERYRGEGDIRCPNCGTEHNSFGQRLAPRSQWGEETGESYGDIINPRDPEGYGYPYEAATHQADAPRDGGGAVKQESLPKGDGKSVGTGPVPKTDHTRWRPNALNDSTNTPPIDTEMDGSPVPTKEQDVLDTPDYEGDFLRDTNSVIEQQDLPTADETGQSTDRNISQDGQDGTWTEAQNDPVTTQALSSIFAPLSQVKAAIKSYQEKEN